jgi:hypothetical protein
MLNTLTHEIWSPGFLHYIYPSLTRSVRWELWKQNNVLFNFGPGFFMFYGHTCLVPYAEHLEFFILFY